MGKLFLRMHTYIPDIWKHKFPVNFRLMYGSSIAKHNCSLQSFLLIHERETRNEGVLELYGILLAVMC